MENVTWRQFPIFSMKLLQGGTNELSKDGFDLIVLSSLICQVPKGQKKGNKVMFRGQKCHLCPIFREFGNEVLPNFKSQNSFTYVRRPPSECPKRINGVELLSTSESSNLDLCDIWASQERYMLFSLPRELQNLMTLHDQIMVTTLLRGCISKTIFSFAYGILI